LARPVTIVDYDPMWPTLYEKEKMKISEALGNKALAIEHIGSTSVPGLGAKPIIDIMVCVQSNLDADICVPLLKGIGYTDVTVQVGNPDWYYCLGKESCGVGYHLHLMKNMSVFSKRHLLFRDRLRANPDIARKYFELKKELAAKYRSDRTAYTESKSAFIESILSEENE